LKKIKNKKQKNNHQRKKLLIHLKILKSQHQKLKTLQLKQKRHPLKNKKFLL